MGSPKPEYKIKQIQSPHLFYYRSCLEVEGHITFAMDMSSSMPFYDAVCKFAVGALILLPFFNCFGCGFGSSFILDKIALGVVAYLIGQIWLSFIQMCSKPLRNNEYMIDRERERFRKNLDKTHGNPPFPFQFKIEDYYKSYYLIMRRQCLGNIPVLEATEAFLRSVWLVVIM